jgi:hypothetical protein
VIRRKIKFSWEWTIKKTAAIGWWPLIRRTKVLFAINHLVNLISVRGLVRVTQQELVLAGQICQVFNVFEVVVMRADNGKAKSVFPLRMDA